MGAAIEGGCLCGSIRYRVDGRPSFISICHCQSCRRASGAPTVAWFVISRAQFTLLAGSPCEYPSSIHVRRSFCGKCGTQLAYEHDSAPDTVELTVASLDEPSAMQPTKEIWLADKLPKWQTPDRVLFVEAIPRTGVGKFLKRDLRERYKGLLIES